MPFVLPSNTACNKIVSNRKQQNTSTWASYHEYYQQQLTFRWFCIAVAAASTALEVIVLLAATYSNNNEAAIRFARFKLPTMRRCEQANAAEHLLSHSADIPMSRQARAHKCTYPQAYTCMFVCMFSVGKSMLIGLANFSLRLLGWLLIVRQQN